MADTMDEEILLDDPAQETINREQKRNKDLAEKLRQKGEEGEAVAKAKEESDAKLASALKDAEFYKNFSTVSSKYTGASDFQEQIREKVNAGYDLEDATVSVLNREGKFSPSVTAPIKAGSPAGGSATTTMKGGGDKELSEMTKEEKREALAARLV